ncbi:MAG: AmmeMemoRadiSam system protein B [Candidatus Komeilibacteria bacterium RIFCSPLOWO2_02_FULL_48_11]|uniref:AmmeMemoRadiSam system protein B n=1 Tax=Candidatus Komeilibacteria bacterium RIFCSPLOWO2_02_FULL_48_11 TaxID=1798553 RepID=A0A1G2BSN4_9BACT|nr:MAG: AmmeMemoRadiSam system protein B [Candidatus Komeilibacteria bacterium RIFCSPLOWO2_02_FULL_48_11]
MIPHHLLASDLIADFYAHLPPTTKKIFLLGPNHYEAGEFYALTSLYNWSTPLGTVKADTDIIRTLIAAGVVRVDEKNVVNEHSLGGHLPFIRHYLPRAKIIPIMLKKEGNEDNIKMLVEQIKPYLSQAGVALVAAVDFSHNLPSSEAAKNDGETLAAMKNFNYQKLFKFGNEHLDSPSSIVALLLAMRSLGIDDLEVINNTNSARLLEFDNLETTSYFDIRFRT